MFDHIDELERTYIELEDKVNDPDIIANQEKWRNLMKEYSSIGPVVLKYREFKAASERSAEALELLRENSDDEFKELLKEELEESRELVEKLKEELKILLLPKDPNDSKNVIRKFVVAQEATKPLYLPATYLECIADMLKEGAGKQR